MNTISWRITSSHPSSSASTKATAQGQAQLTECCTVSCAIAMWLALKAYGLTGHHANCTAQRRTKAFW
jgi:hypothetical protein